MRRVIINYEFGIDEKVKYDRLNIIGIVTTLSYDKGGIKYYVQFPQAGMWVDEDELIEVTE